MSKADIPWLNLSRRPSHGTSRRPRCRPSWTNLAVLKNGRAKAVRFSTLAALCEVLDCQPGDLLRWEADGAADRTMH
ncbi:helix-turn-helix domain-containing protein [Streptomyces caelestis]|jgi:DNA-binding Xre family transcriptional regulator|uniref:DNA-binding Xre family transcriptional regulator n=1 Tax=Streptomyces caelestis TaxID=36816 RepID=A0A7W9H342_9ACTN|nr:helix-turn-helix domain-containing protein [Streptomyces caelestis]MBB5794715.1 DNA-binding Xre family transcriptional regulator [Streptomyces caelestis]GGW28680.1 hypothetical protein GCM10010320_04560 [Streptomyces caelestis]